jgi:DNA modification methylase
MVEVLEGDCVYHLSSLAERGEQFHLTFLDPPFNQGKDYENFEDKLHPDEYWEWMKQVCHLVNRCSVPGAAVYFMQREKNTEPVLRILRETGWSLQNLIIWFKKTSAVPHPLRFGKQYQIIAFATKGNAPRVFNRLRIDAPPRPEHRIPREDGLFVTDCWDDIRELTSGYFAGDEALRTDDGQRFHKQQSPIALLLRIILASTKPGDKVLDPFAGTGTTGVVAHQLDRHCVLIDNSPRNISKIIWRLESQRPADSVNKWRYYYRFTPNLDEIWPVECTHQWEREKQINLFEEQSRYGDH